MSEQNIAVFRDLTLVLIYILIVEEHQKEPTVEIIHFTHNDVGSIDWELPHDLADRISQLDPTQREIVLEQIEIIIKSQMLILMRALELGRKTGEGFDLLRDALLDVAVDLQRLAGH